MLLRPEAFVMQSLGGNASGASTMRLQFALPQPPPSGLAATPASGAVALTWTAPYLADAFQIRMRRTGTPRWSKAIRTRSESPAYTVTGLRNGKSYQFQVRVGAYGVWSATVTAVAGLPRR